MAAREGGGHPFNWFLIGFVVGVAVTLAAMLYLGVRHDGRSSDDAEIPASQAPAPVVVKHAPPVVHAPAPAVKKADAAPRDDRPHGSQHDLDAQVAEDAAAAGMTSRPDPGQAPDPAPDVPH
jgi:hypothetical protein